MLKIIVDFNNMTRDGERILVARDTERDREVAEKLTPGLRVLLHEVQDFEVEAIVQPEQVFPNVTWWYGTPDWTTRVDLA